VNFAFGTVNNALATSHGGPCSSSPTQNSDRVAAGSSPTVVKNRPVKTASAENNNTNHQLFDRLFSYKYFEYVDPDYCSSRLNNSFLEVANHFYPDPVITNFCPPPPPSDPHGYETWNAAKRYQFFLQAKLYNQTTLADENNHSGNTITSTANCS
jgi:hypothetical protein